MEHHARPTGPAGEELAADALLEAIIEMCDDAGLLRM